ncbi:MAG: hypothetical protein Q7T21_15265 [Gallionella sp.]|nr:hypothetical protein [Gallionella sp.]
MSASPVPTKYGFLPHLRSLAFASILGVLLGLFFLVLGSFLGSIGWINHEPIDLFLTGFACGFIAAVISAGNDRGWKE